MNNLKTRQLNNNLPKKAELLRQKKTLNGLLIMCELLNDKITPYVVWYQDAQGNLSGGYYSCSEKDATHYYNSHN